MEVKYVYLCINYDDVPKEQVVSELVEEGYGKSYKFFFGNELEMVEYADEVWTFGNVGNVESYKKAVDLGCDIWNMG